MAYKTIERICEAYDRFINMATPIIENYGGYIGAGFFGVTGCVSMTKDSPALTGVLTALSIGIGMGQVVKNNHRHLEDLTESEDL